MKEISFTVCSTIALTHIAQAVRLSLLREAISVLQYCSNQQYSKG